MNLSIGMLALALVAGLAVVGAVAPTAEALGGNCNGYVDYNCVDYVGDPNGEDCTAWVSKCIVG